MSITLALSKMYQFRGLDMVKKDDFLADHSLQGDSPKMSQCLKITEKVSFNITSEASYVYILSGQKLIKKCQKWSILASF